jgi:Predicted DNA alkylation repair enzyme
MESMRALCKNYLIKCNNFKRFIDDWVCSNQLYYKRAGFTLIATQAINDKDISEDEVNKYFEYIEQFSDDDRVHVYKSISCALREMGKVNMDLQEKAIIVAHNLCEESNIIK